MAVRKLGLLIVALAVAMGAQPVRAQDEPATYVEEIAQLRTMCEGGQLAFFAAPDRSVDFNGDGVNDILSQGGGGVGCVPNDPAETSSYGMVGCPAAGCELHLYLSGPSGYRAAWHSGAVSSWRIEGGARPRIHVIDVYACGDAGLSRCELAIQWDGRRMAQRQLRRWYLERNEVPPELSPAWRVGTTDDGSKVVSTQMIGTVPALNLRCARGAPVMTLFPEHRALRMSAVVIDADGRRVTLAPRPNRDGTWSAPLGADAIDLLTGRASQAVLRVNGAAIGRLSLAGSTLAIDEALRPCRGGGMTSAPQPAVTSAPPRPVTMPAQPSDEAQIRALVSTIYGRYAVPPGSEGVRAGDDFSPSLDALVERATAGSEDGLGADPFCECQDYENSRFVIQALSANASTGEARIVFSNFGQSITLTLRLVKTPRGWRVDDIIGSNGRSFRASLRPSPRRRR